MSARKLLWPENGEMTSLGFELQDDVLYLEDHAFNVASVFSKCHIRQWSRRRASPEYAFGFLCKWDSGAACMAHWHVIVPRRQDDMACFGLAHTEIVHELHDGFNTASVKFKFAIELALCSRLRAKKLTNVQRGGRGPKLKWFFRNGIKQ